MEAFEILMLGLCQCQSLQRLQLVVGTETKRSGEGVFSCLYKFLKLKADSLFAQARSLFVLQAEIE